MRELTTSRGSYEELVPVEFGLNTVKSCNFSANLKVVVTHHWIADLTWQQVPGHRIRNRECSTAEPTVTILQDNR